MVVRSLITSLPVLRAGLALACALSLAAPAVADDGNRPGAGTGLSLVSGFGDGVTPGGPTAPCLGLGAGETGLTRCLSRGGGFDAVSPGTARVGLRYGVGDWLSLDAGLGFAAGLRDAGAGLGVSSALSPGWNAVGAGGDAGTDRLVGSLSAFVDLNAATGWQPAGVRSYVGANLSVGHVTTPAGLFRDGTGAAVPVQAMSGSGVSWGATAGSNVTIGGGLSLDFAYRYTGQESTGPLDHGAAPGLNAGGLSRGSGAGEDANHGMSIGLRLQF
jgi:hypothetical protein